MYYSFKFEIIVHFFVIFEHTFLYFNNFVFIQYHGVTPMSATNICLNGSLLDQYYMIVNPPSARAYWESV